MSPFEIVSEMYGVGVAERLRDEGLLARNTTAHTNRPYEPTHLKVVLTWDPTVPVPSPSARPYVSHSLPVDVKDWFRRILWPKTSLVTVPRRLVVTYNADKTGKSQVTRIKNFVASAITTMAAPGLITVEVVPCVLVEIDRLTT